MANKNSYNTYIMDMAGDDPASGTHVSTDHDNGYNHPRLANSIRPLDTIEREAIETAINLCQGNIPKAAVYLDVAPSTIYRKIKQWNKKDLQKT